MLKKQYNKNFKTAIFILGNIPLKILDHDIRRGSWALQRKISEDSNMSCSRQDSSTSTFPMSRSSFSSDSSSQPRPARPLLSTAIMNNRDSIRSVRENKPKLCRQSAVIDEKSQTYNKQNLTRKLSKEKSVDELCPACARKEGFKSKELEEKFACFYNRLVESSCGESSEYSSKEDQILFSSDIQSIDERAHGNNDKIPKDSSSQKPRIEVNPMAEAKSVDFSTGDKIGGDKQKDTSDHLNTKDSENERCRSLININMKANSEKTKKSSSDNTLVKLSLSNLPVTFRSFPSHDAYNGKRTDLKTKSTSTTLRSSKSENVVTDYAGNKNKTSTADNHPVYKEEDSSTDNPRWSLLSITNKENEIKASSSSPNIAAKICETSPLIDNNDE